MIKNLPTFVTRRTEPPTVWQTVQAILINTLAYTVIIGGTFYIAHTSTHLQPAPSNEEKAQTERERVQEVNKPTFHTHKAQARKVCKGKVVPAGDDKFANWVIVTKVNGDTVRMHLDRAFKLNQNQDTNVWVIGICKKDLLPPVVYK